MSQIVTSRRRTRPSGCRPRRWRTPADGPRCARRDGSGPGLRDALGQGPGDEDAVALESQVPVQASGVVLLDHEARRACPAGGRRPIGSGVFSGSRFPWYVARELSRLDVVAFLPEGFFAESDFWVRDATDPPYPAFRFTPARGGIGHGGRSRSRSSRRRNTMHVLERAIRSVDQAQQRFRPTAFAYGVVKKFGDDRGGSLCALLAFYGFLSLFPLLLLLVTILGFVGGGITRGCNASSIRRSPSSRSWARSSAAISTGFTTATSWVWSPVWSVSSGDRKVRCRPPSMRRRRSGTSLASSARTSGFGWGGPRP